MDVLHNLAFGFEHALTWQNLMFCAIGCTVGTLVGLLPGLGPLATISILLPPCPVIASSARRRKLTGEVATLAARVDEHLKKMGAVWK